MILLEGVEILVNLVYLVLNVEAEDPVFSWWTFLDVVGDLKSTVYSLLD